MSVSKSGCYRWRARQGMLDRYEQDRQLLTKLLAEQHRKHPSLVDPFNNELLAHQPAPIQGSTKPYYHCPEQLKLLAGKKNEEQTPQGVLHTDRGPVYSSQAFRQAHEPYNILRSMSRVGTPTDNAIIEAINGWIKEELFLDFGLATANRKPCVPMRGC